MDWKLVFGPWVTAAIISGVVAWFVARHNASAVLTANADKIKADLQIAENKLWADFDTAEKKLLADRQKEMTDKAWADYELRRDSYINFAREIAVLFKAPHATDRTEFHKIARTIRIIGSDEVVRALNALTSSIIENRQEEHDHRYRALFNAIRKDIRTIHTLPPEGTALDEDAFPLES